MAKAGLQAGVTGGWIAAGELPSGPRRAARVGVMVAGAGLGYVLSSDEKEPAAPAPDSPDSPSPDVVIDKRRLAVTLGVGALSIGAVAGRRRLEKRWLAGLRRSGHAHPERALALRIGALSFALTLARQLTDARSPTR